jgi:AraC-like DNA-binding protein
MKQPFVIPGRGLRYEAPAPTRQQSVVLPTAAGAAPAPTESVFVIRMLRPQAAPAAAQGKLAACMEHMLAHLDKPVKIPELCALAGLSPSRFFELFKSVTGDSPLNWFTRARMEWAGALLQQPDLQIKQVAERVGYPDPLYFSRVFRSVHGVPPTVFRAQAKFQRTTAALPESAPPPALLPRQR